MKLIKQSFEILEQEIPVRKPDDYSEEHFREQYIDSVLKHIEKCGKTCYRSEHTIKDGSAQRFIDRLIESKHFSVLEHSAVYLSIPSNVAGSGIVSLRYKENPYSKWRRIQISNNDYIDYIITTYRVIIENHWEDDLQYLCEPTEYHEKRHTVLLHSCIHVYKDLTRHRKASFSIESTRFCNYTQDKFGNEIKFVKPCWDYEQFDVEKVSYKQILRDIEFTYFGLIQQGWQPQQAAEILPQCTAADVVMSAYDSDWDFIFQLRAKETTGKVHPLVLEIMKPLYEEFKERKYIK